MHTIRLASEPSSMPGMVWLRLAVDPSGYMSELFDEARRNHIPTPISLPAAPDLPVTGQPALGWVNLLDVRQAADGRGLELWGLTRWLAAAEPHLSSGEPLWAQVRIPDHHIDGRTGVDIGARLQPIELVPAPFPTHLHKSPVANTRHITLTKDTPTMTTNSTTSALLAILPDYAQGAPNLAIALERAALATIPEAKRLSRERLYEFHVHPALAELGRHQIEKASKAGRLRQALPSLASAMRPAPASQTKRPTLDVRTFEGPNRFIKLMAYARQQAGRPLSHEEAHAAAAQLNRTHDVIA